MITGLVEATDTFGKCHEVPVWESSPMGPFEHWPSGGGCFEYFYGFIGGENNQWDPALYEGTTEIMNIYTLKMAGVFMISTCTLSLRTSILPRWMAYLGLVLALFLLFNLGFFSWAPTGLSPMGAPDQRAHPAGQSRAITGRRPYPS